MRKTLGWVLLAAVVAVGIAWVSLMLVTPALAAGDGERVGENVGKLLGGWARSLYVGIAAIVALMFLLNRRVADLAVFVVAAVLVGGFVLAPAEVAGTIRDIWNTITG
jgi:Kef-type K+ transport system membrane component KefB